MDGGNIQTMGLTIYRCHSPGVGVGARLAMVAGLYNTHYVITLMSLFSSLFGGRSRKRAVAFMVSGKALLALGWKETELKQILTDFQRLYRDRLPTNFSTEVHTGDNGMMQVTFPADIDPEIFCFLINYVQYPKDFDLSSRTILVAGQATINSDFLPSGQSLIGKPMTFYIPADDQAYDIVFARVEGQSYEYPFTSVHWRVAREPRFPAGLNELIK